MRVIFQAASYMQRLYELVVCWSLGFGSTKRSNIMKVRHIYAQLARQFPSVGATACTTLEEQTRSHNNIHPPFPLLQHLITYPTTLDPAHSAVLSQHYPSPPFPPSTLPLHSQAHTPFSHPHSTTTSPSHLHKTVSPYLPHHPNRNPAPATHLALGRGLSV